MSVALLHALHAAIVIAGVAVVTLLLRPGRAFADRRHVAALRRAAADGTLVDLARARAQSQLGPQGIKDRQLLRAQPATLEEST